MNGLRVKRLDVSSCLTAHSIARLTEGCGSMIPSFIMAPIFRGLFTPTSMGVLSPVQGTAVRLGSKRWGFAWRIKRIKWSMSLNVIHIGPLEQKTLSSAENPSLMNPCVGRVYDVGLKP